VVAADFQVQKEIRDSLVHQDHQDRRVSRDVQDKMEYRALRVDRGFQVKQVPRVEMVKKENLVYLVSMVYRVKMVQRVFQVHLGRRENQDSRALQEEVFLDQKDSMVHQVELAEMDQGVTKEKEVREAFQGTTSMVFQECLDQEDPVALREEPD
jgi:hypothetical protein